jgi:hypothetical protein
MVRFPYSLKYKERPLALVGVLSCTCGNRLLLQRRHALDPGVADAVRYLNLRGQSVTFPGSALKPSGRRTVRSIHVEKAIGKSNPTNP